MLKPRDMQRAFRLAYCLHPERYIAQCVAYDACDWLSVLQRTQERRQSSHHYKLTLSEKRCLQASVFCVSERWEVDQERKTQLIDGNGYQPTAEDLLVRYIKLLIWKTMDRRSCHAAVGLGCHLYQYRPEQICTLAPDLYDKANIRRINSYRLDEISTRFPTLDLVRRPPYGEIKVHTRQPSSGEQELVLNALVIFTPWWTPHLRPRESVLELFGNRNPTLEWKRIHALIDPDCAGLARLIRAYNASIKGQPVQLDDPDDELEIPDFRDPVEANGSTRPPGSRSDRFVPPPLSGDAITTIKHALEHNQHRRKRYRPSLLRVRVDGKDQSQFYPHAGASQPFEVPVDTTYIEIVGQDDEGDLLLAVFPISDRYRFEGRDTHLVVVQEGGQVIELQTMPLRQVNGTITTLRMQITYSESRPTRVPKPWKRLSLHKVMVAARERVHQTSWLLRPALAGLAITALGGITWWAVSSGHHPSLPGLQPRQARNVESSPFTPRIHSDALFLIDALPDPWPGSLSVGTPFQSPPYYRTLQREMFVRLVTTFPPATPLQPLLNTIEDLWDEVDTLQTPQALIDYFRRAGLTPIAEHIERTRAQIVPQRPAAWDQQLEAAAIKQGLKNALRYFRADQYH